MQRLATDEMTSPFMLLSPDDADLFFKLHKLLMHFVNGRLHVVKSRPSVIAGHPTYPQSDRLKIRNALLENIGLIERFTQENPDGLDDQEREIVASWKHAVADKFIVLRYLKKHTIFLSSANPPVAYGVLGLCELIPDVVGPCPMIVDAVLLPFKGCIIYDGVVMGYNIALGPGIRASLDESYREAKSRHGIVTTLPIVSAPAPRTRKPAKGRKKSPTIQGRWRITEMEMWDQDFVNAEVEGFFRFDDSGRGEFQFGYVQGVMDCELIDRGGQPGVEWTWEGSD